MQRRKFHDQEHTLERIDGVGDKRDLAERSSFAPKRIAKAKPREKKKPRAAVKGEKMNLAARNRPAALPSPSEAQIQATMMQQMQAQFLKSMRTDLHAKSGLPTLAERIQQEGAAAQLRRKAKPKKK